MSKKILLSVCACEPNRGSEPGAGWNWVIQIARFYEIWVVTRAINQQPIEEALEKESIPNIHWVYFDLPWWVQFWNKSRRGSRLYYYLWQIVAYFVGKRLHKEMSFDLVHHLTLGTYWMPSFLALLPLPFVWGPVGGGDSAPRAFYQGFGLRGYIFEKVRDFVNLIVIFNPFVRLTARRAILALANTKQTIEKLRLLGSRNRILFSHMGVSLNEVSMFHIRQGNPFRMLSVGRLIHWKGFHLALEAFKRFNQEFTESEYWLIGDGEERQRLEQLTQRLGIKKRVVFWGKIPRTQVLEKLAECDVLIHPSLHDSAPSVCLEAMAAGRPVICLDIGGPALQVTGETGFKIRANTPEQVVTDLGEAMVRLAQNSDLRKRMGEAARKRVEEHFNWDKKGEWINNIYEQIFQV